MMKYHTTKNGRKIPLNDLSDSHLHNIIRWIERKAEDGFTVLFGGGTPPYDAWMDEDVLKGERAKKYLKYYDYIDEFYKRRNKTPTNHY